MERSKGRINRFQTHAVLRGGPVMETILKSSRTCEKLLAGHTGTSMNKTHTGTSSSLRAKHLLFRMKSGDWHCRPPRSRRSEALSTRRSRRTGTEVERLASERMGRRTFHAIHMDSLALGLHMWRVREANTYKTLRHEPALLGPTLL